MDLLKFPSKLTGLAWKSSKAVRWQVTSQRSGSKLRTFTSQTIPIVEITAKLNRLTDDEARDLLGFVISVKGSASPFLWKDPEDYKAECKVIHDDSYGLMDRPHWKVDTSSMLGNGAIHIDKMDLYINGGYIDPSHYTLNGVNIVLDSSTSNSSLLNLSARFTYSWVVHFKSDSFTVQKEFYDFNRSKEFTLETWAGVV